MSVKLADGGIDVQMESLRALLLGGIAFETPPDSNAAGRARPTISSRSTPTSRRRRSAGFGHQLQLVSYFPGSVAGLDVGADVTLHGLKIGEVTDVGLVYDPQARSHRGAGALPRRGRAHRQHRGRPRSRLRARSPRR